MTENENTTTPSEQPVEATVVIKISDKNLQYKSDFTEAETIFWLESVKGLIIKKAFDMAGLKENND